MANDDYAEDELAAQRARSLGERMSDAVAGFGGSWAFLLLFAVVTLAWIVLNTGREGFDPYPYLLMNLVLNVVAAIQAPIIMMSQRRQETRDRARSHNTYRLILAAEREIRALHEKLDRLTTGR